ncbi:MAG: hypothetical protein ACRDNH_08010 [Gaiellaceae bacterium]
MAERIAMAFTIRSVEYYYVNVRDELGAAYGVLSQLAGLGVNLLAFTAVPSGPSLTQFTLFPEDPDKLVAQGRSAGLALDGPYHALLVQGDDELGALATVHARLVAAGVDILRVLWCHRRPRRLRLCRVCTRGPVREGGECGCAVTGLP